MRTAQDVIVEFAHRYPLCDLEVDFVDRELYGAKDAALLWDDLHALMGDDGRRAIPDDPPLFCHIAIPASIVYNLLTRDAFMSTLPMQDRHFIVRFAVHIVDDQWRRRGPSRLLFDALLARWLAHVPADVQAGWEAYWETRAARLQRRRCDAAVRSQVLADEEAHASYTFLASRQDNPMFEDEMNLRAARWKAAVCLQRAWLARRWARRKRAVAVIEGHVLRWLHRPGGSAYQRALASFRAAQSLP